ncbi:hypothetical protein FNJ47_40640 [Bradyrhizobium sp. UFLA 03-164]|uniref:Uncharacterized protein n=1 Tax=Bradyrhizobium uaiense TaxID=2594946 RepID=A0A6P1BWG7_9BRAD|nr:hypothetical protein [Bradyrhizobium uaiense]
MGYPQAHGRSTAVGIVVPGLVPGIHVFLPNRPSKQDVDGRVKPGHHEILRQNRSDQILLGDDLAQP